MYEAFPPVGASRIGGVGSSMDYEFRGYSRRENAQFVTSVTTNSL
jgi:hypothetical protein